MVGWRHGAGAGNGEIGRDAADDRSVGVVDGDGLCTAAAVTALIDGGVGAFDGSKLLSES